jgi:peptide/nickel transport system substrate-binding protein
MMASVSVFVGSRRSPAGCLVRLCGRWIASPGLAITGLLLLLVCFAGPARAATLEVAASADLTGLDPMGPAATGTYIHGMLVYDTLFAQTEKLAVRPQMVGDEVVSADKLTYTMTLRPGLLFHDGSAVTTRDVIASLKRWMGLDIVGRTMAIDVAGMEAVDDRTFVLRMKRPFPVEQALANSGSGLAVIMRAQEATAGAFTRTTPVIGSGPFRFVADEWAPGDKFVYEKFAGYVPRQEPPDGLAGGKIPKLDRIVFHVMPDASTKALALQTGEVDFIDALPFDQAEVLAARPGITVGRLSDTYNTFFLRPNALYPPFDNVKARQALALAINQVDYMTVSFVKPDWGQPCLSFFVCGSPNGITTGSAPYAHQDLARARELLKESGYKGEKVVLINSHETLFVGMAGDFAAENLKQIGLNIEVAESDWGTFMTRRNNKAEPDHGGWNLFITSVSGSGTYSPLSSSVADTTCGGHNFAGWACDEEAARLRDAWIHEPDLARQRAILEQLSARLWEVMPTVILGQRAQLYAWRNVITGFVHPPSLVTVFWNIQKAGQ